MFYGVANYTRILILFYMENSCYPYREAAHWRWSGATTSWGGKVHSGQPSLLGIMGNNLGKHSASCFILVLHNCMREWFHVTCFYWLQGYVNKIDFDYMEYARQRFRQYWLRKKRLLGSADNYVNGHVAYGTGSG